MDNRLSSQPLRTGEYKLMSEQNDIFDKDIEAEIGDSTIIAADLSGILGTTLCGFIKLCDQYKLPVETVIDK